MSEKLNYEELQKRLSADVKKDIEEQTASEREAHDAKFAALEAKHEELQNSYTEMESKQTEWASSLFKSNPDAAPEELELGIRPARMIRALTSAKGNLEHAVQKSDEWWGKENTVSKALTTGIGADGGFLIPTEFSNEIIELLRARSIVRAMGARTIPMNTGVLTMPRLSGGATSSYVGESSSQNASQETFEDLQMVWKKLRTTVPISNELVRYSSPSADAVVRDDMVASMATREDVAFIRDDGTLGTPRGLFNWAGNTTASAAADDASDATLAEVEEDLRVLLGNLEDNNVRMINPGWLMSPRSKNYLLMLRDSNGNLAFPELRTSGKSILTYPLGISNNILNNIGANTRESQLYFVDFADVLIGEASQLEIVVSNEATYTDSAGTLRSAFDRDETVIKVIARHDFMVRHDNSVAVITDIPYGV